MAPQGGVAASRTAPHRQERPGITTRLTTGWQDSSGPASLRDHLERYGPVPGDALSGGGRHGTLIDSVTQAGLTGRGGAGFPTGVKLRSVASRRGPAIVVANGMESEPASEKDKALLARSPHLVLDGAVLAARAIGAESVHLCLPRHREPLIRQLLDAVEERVRRGMDPLPILLRGVPHYYVSSEESALTHWLNGGEAKPTAVPPRPFEKGVNGRPTLIDNVETLAHIGMIARFGAGWFRQAGAPDAPGTMLSTVTGAVSEPGVYEVELGSAIGDVLALSGVSKDAGAVLIGGYFGTWHHLADVAALGLSINGLRAAGSSPGAGVLFALPAGACGLSETARVLAWLAGQGAGQCGPCVFGLPAIADDFAQLAAGRPKGSVLDRLNRRLSVIGGRGACRHPDGAVRLAKSALATFAADVKAHVSHRRCMYAAGGAKGVARAGAAGLLPVPRAMDGEAWQ